MSDSPKRIAVGLGEHAYDVLVGAGLLARAGELVAAHLPRRRTAVVTDETVAALHGDSLVAALATAGIAASVIALPPGEQSKSFAGLEDLCARLLALELDRGDRIVALGGGVVGDLAGFAAAIYKRGIGFIQVPTTLLAQVDSSVGGKTAIDTPAGKNLIGAFHQPVLVLADLDVLTSLPEREMRAGYAEVLKYGLLGDAEFFTWLEHNGAAVLGREPMALAHAVGRSVEMKAAVVAEDERETGRRALLNLGHTFGHALESQTGFGATLLHGEAVALGCAMAFRFSATLGLCATADAAHAEAAIAAAGLPVRFEQISPPLRSGGGSVVAADSGSPPPSTSLPPPSEGEDRLHFSAAALAAHMAQDKKAEGGKLVFVLARAIGEAFVAKDIDRAHLIAFLRDEGAAP